MSNQNNKAVGYISTGLQGIVSDPTSLPKQSPLIAPHKPNMPVKQPKKLNSELKASLLNAMRPLPFQILPRLSNKQQKKKALAHIKANYRIAFKSAKSGVVNVYGGTSHNAIMDQLFNVLESIDQTFHERLYEPHELEQISKYITRLITQYKIKLYKGLPTKTGSGEYLLISKKDALQLSAKHNAHSKLVGKKRKQDTQLEQVYAKERSQNAYSNFEINFQPLHLPKYAFLKPKEYTRSKSDILRSYKDKYHLAFVKDGDDKKIYKVHDLIYQDFLNSLYKAVQERGYILRELNFNKDQLNELSTAFDRWINTGKLRGKFVFMLKSDATQLHNRTIALRKRERKKAKQDGVNTNTIETIE